VAEATNDGEIHPAMAAVLEQDRESLNQRFQLRQRAGAKIDAMAFQRHLRTAVNELVGAVAAVHVERVRAVVNALFDVSLDLFSAGLLGPEARHPYVAAEWRDVLPQAVALLARDPVRVAGCASNAVDHLTAQAAGRPTEWIAVMGRLAPHCDGVPQWLAAGKVAAWQAGLVQYRSAALGIARELPSKTLALLFDVPNDTAEADMRQRLDRLESDRWYSPHTRPDAEQSLRVVRTTGGFRGFGGPCVRPPTVTLQGDRLLVSDGDTAWALLADAFGELWHRMPGSTASPTAGRHSPTTVIDATGRVSWDGRQERFEELADASSFACDGQTLAVTLPTSHHLFLVARVDKGQQ
jgi:hypothetical protein